MTPSGASKTESQDKLKQTHRKIRSVRPPDSKVLQVGQLVGVYRYKSKFQKASNGSWTTGVLRINDRLNTNPPTYILEDSRKEGFKGTFYRSELLPSRSGFDGNIMYL
jgi:hypothetical protein